MHTLRRPDIRMPSIGLRGLLADARAGALIGLADMTRGLRHEEEAFLGITDDF